MTRPRDDRDPLGAFDELSPVHASVGVSWHSFLDHPNTTAYLQRLMMRPSFVRVLEEAEPYFVHFPG
jgi:hypothetical protein